MKAKYDAVISGGGFFGASIAIHLKEMGMDVLICEKEGELMKRASYSNQARIHNGYHYPKSFLTALRSRINFQRFSEDYKECVVNTFEKYYAIPYKFSNVSGNQFLKFCQKIKAPIEEASLKVKKLFNHDLIEKVFSVREYAYDADLLRKQIIDKLLDLRIEIKTECEVIHAKQNDDEEIEVTYSKSGVLEVIKARFVFNCTYSDLNKLLDSSGLPLVRLKHEVAELALVEVPDEIKDKGVTVMCGPFFSCMPFPPRRLHSLSHVRYTPHSYWHTGDVGHSNNDKFFKDLKKSSNFIPMVYDAKRYMPILEGCQYKDSLWEIKTVLPKSEVDDSRPILFQKNEKMKGLYSIMGGKIDNVYDILDSLRRCPEKVLTY